MADRHNRDLDRKPAPLPDPLKSKTVDSHAHLELIPALIPSNLLAATLTPWALPQIKIPLDPGCAKTAFAIN